MSGPWIELTMPFTQALVHFYQVAAAQDKLVNNMSYIKQGSSHHCSWSWVILLTMCCFLSFQWLGWSGFSHPTNFEMALLACFCGLLENITKLKVAHSDVLILSSKNVSAYFQKSGCFMSSMLSKNTNQTTPGFFFHYPVSVPFLMIFKLKQLWWPHRYVILAALLDLCVQSALFSSLIIVKPPY